MGDWSCPQKRNRMIDKFKNIFEGLTIAYGQYQKGEKGENGKQKERRSLYVSKLRENC